MANSSTHSKRRKSFGYLIGIDIGTSNIKIGCYDLEGGRTVGLVKKTRTYKRGEHVTYDPNEIWNSIAQGLQNVTKEIGDSALIRGISISSMGEAGAPLNKRGQYIYPIISWLDKRTIPQWRWWCENVGQDRIYRYTGLLLHSMYTINKIMWLRDNEPEIYQKMDKWLCMEDLIIFKLSGEYVTDYSIAWRTMGFDIHRREWSSDIFDLARVKMNLMPRAYPSGVVVGEVTKRASIETGLRKGTPVVTGGHDHCCAALAAGAIKGGELFNSAGTSEALALVIDKPLLSGEFGGSFACGPHVVKDKYLLRGTVTSSGMILDWLRNILDIKKAGGKLSSKGVYNNLHDLAQRSTVGARGLFLVPHFYGSGTPHYDPLDKGTIVGLTASHKQEDIVRASLEGVCYELRLNIDLLERYTGRKITRIRITGGGSKAEFQLQLRADVTGRCFEAIPTEQSASFGAAILAGIGVGVYKDASDVLDKTQVQKRVIDPNPDVAKEYYKYYTRGYIPTYKSSRRISRTLFKLSESHVSQKTGT